ncbi:hypothetical protein B0T26DRAFT_636032 [Lasiosphaeria miniovina]|uniref:Apple domain-containing protein n=1 Tax=Lasiosphaeria miniovina TaxID=1954250 RepID=A0AA40B4C3_9PEZI|nr:uncharacterized protein B0T26DRAFT_636032 [Lasiosphaeria miniovina]KAK0727426.1 hypothetical protein B0T26DRAFT_636032 [Lasiosphaeria miniovina]
MYLFWAAVAFVAATTSSSSGTTLVRASVSSEVQPRTCTTGPSASEQRPDGFPINDFTYIKPAEDWVSYAVKPDWYADQFVSGPHYMSYNHESDPFGAFKCQFTCNSAADCNSFFVWYAEIGTTEEHLNCVLFDAVIDASAFVLSNGTIGGGGYDRLCKKKPAPS